MCVDKKSFCGMKKDGGTYMKLEHEHVSKNENAFIRYCIEQNNMA